MSEKEFKLTITLSKENLKKLKYLSLLKDKKHPDLAREIIEKFVQSKKSFEELEGIEILAK
jgi:hypothetical protein